MPHQRIACWGTLLRLPNMKSQSEAVVCVNTLAAGTSFWFIIYYQYFRSANNSFLRRGASANSGLRKNTQSNQLNLWCPVVHRTSHPDLTSVSCSSTPTTPVKSRPQVNLTRGRSDISLPTTPKHLTRLILWFLAIFPNMITVLKENIGTLTT